MPWRRPEKLSLATLEALDLTGASRRHLLYSLYPESERAPHPTITAKPGVPPALGGSAEAAAGS